MGDQTHAGRDGPYVSPKEPPSGRDRLQLWEGDYLDARGLRGSLRMQFAGDEGRLKGDFSLTLALRDAPQVIQGSIEAETQGDRLVLRAKAELIDKEPAPAAAPIEFSLKLRPGGSYAKEVLYGVVEPAPQMNLAGGVLMAWRFARGGA